jgi:nucleoid-associated protein YgaU
MAKKKIARKNNKAPKVVIKSVEKGSLFSKIKWGESYTSLILGVLVVIVATILLVSLAKGKGMIGTGASDSNVNGEQDKASVKMYVVKSGDDLWTIADKEYGSGYNWVDIASANKLLNPGLIEEGTKLIIPDVQKRSADSEFVEAVEPQAQEDLENQNIKTEIKETPVENFISNPGSITGGTYTVIEGDSLWDIAIRAYGDGYRWIEIAQNNYITNPDIIFAGSVLNIPR